MDVVMGVGEGKAGRASNGLELSNGWGVGMGVRAGGGCRACVRLCCGVGGRKVVS